MSDVSMEAEREQWIERFLETQTRLGLPPPKLETLAGLVHQQARNVADSSAGVSEAAILAKNLNWLRAQGVPKEAITAFLEDE